MKAILHADGTFRMLVSDDAITAPDQTREWVTTEPPTPGANEVVEESSPLVGETAVTQQWTVRPKTRDELVPVEIATWRFRSALKLSGLYTSVVTVLDSLPEPAKTVAFEQFEYSNTTERDHPTIAQLAGVLNLTQQQVDDVFVLGASL